VLFSTLTPTIKNFVVVQDDYLVSIRKCSLVFCVSSFLLLNNTSHPLPPTIWSTLHRSGYKFGNFLFLSASPPLPLNSKYFHPTQKREVRLWDGSYLGVTVIVPLLRRFCLLALWWVHSPFRNVFFQNTANYSDMRVPLPPSTQNHTQDIFKRSQGFLIVKTVGSLYKTALAFFEIYYFNMHICKSFCAVCVRVF